MRAWRDEREAGMVCFVGLVFLVDLVCLVDRNNIQPDELEKPDRPAPARRSQTGNFRLARYALRFTKYGGVVVWAVGQ